MHDDLTIPAARDLPPGRRRELQAHLLSELRYLRSEREPFWRRRRGVVVAAAASVLLLLGVGGYRVWTAPRPVVAEASFAWHFTDPRDLAATAPLIVLGTVERVDRGRSYDHGDEVETTRRLTVRVERRLAGTLAGDRVVVQDQGWIRVDGRPQVPFSLEGTLRLEAGDRALLFLRKDPQTGDWEQLNDQAAYRVQGTRILPSTRADPLVQRIEGKPLLELERLIAEAQAALERGDLEPTPPGRGGG